MRHNPYLTRRIIDEFNKIAEPGKRYDYIFKKMCRKLGITYADIRVAFRVECDVDIGRRGKMYDRII